MNSKPIRTSRRPTSALSAKVTRGVPDNDFQDDMSVLPRRRYPLRCLLKAIGGPELSQAQYEESVAHFEAQPFLSNSVAITKLRQHLSDFLSRVQSSKSSLESVVSSPEALISDYELACLTRFDEYGELLGVHLIRLFDRIFPLSPKSLLTLLCPFPNSRDLLLTYIAARLPNFSIWDMAELNPKDQVQIYRRHYFLRHFFSQLPSDTASAPPVRDRCHCCGYFNFPSSPSNGRVVVMMRELVHHGGLDTRKKLQSIGTSRQSALLEQLMDGIQDIPVSGIDEALEWLRWIFDSHGTLDIGIKQEIDQSDQINIQQNGKRPSITKHTLLPKKRKLIVSNSLALSQTIRPKEEFKSHDSPSVQSLMVRLQINCMEAFCAAIDNLSETIIEVN